MLAIVSASSPIVYLTRLDLFDLLRRLHDEVFVPAAVWREITEGGRGLPEAERLASGVVDGWIRVRAPVTPAASLGIGSTSSRLAEMETLPHERSIEAAPLSKPPTKRTALRVHARRLQHAAKAL